MKTDIELNNSSINTTPSLKESIESFKKFNQNDTPDNNDYSEDFDDYEQSNSKYIDDKYSNINKIYSDT